MLIPVKLDRVRSEWRDAALYAGCALFALVTWLGSGFRFYREWGRIALWAYMGGVLGSVMVAALRARNNAWRNLILVGVAAGATVVPMTLEVISGNAQDEVQVVERAGQLVLHGQSPYRLVDRAHFPPVGPRQTEADAFNPYLPLMAILGMAHDTKGPAPLTDPRVAFSIVTLAVTVVALALCKSRGAKRRLVFLCMTALPTAALPLATGGDDVPVAALCLLGLVLMQRKRPGLAGLVLGLGASMKMTAWPLAGLGVLACVPGDRRRYVAGLGCVMVPVIVPSALVNLPAFFQNVVAFPLGLAGVSSSAASALPGHELVVASPRLAHLVLPGLAALGGLGALLYLVRRPPRSPASVARFTAWAMAGAIVLAPSTRVGYLLYPVDMVAWSLVLDAETALARVESGYWSDCTNSRSVTDVLPETGDVEKLVGSTMSSRPQ